MLTDELKPSTKPLLSAGPAKPPEDENENRPPMVNIKTILAAADGE